MTMRAVLSTRSVSTLPHPTPPYHSLSPPQRRTAALELKRPQRAGSLYTRDRITTPCHSSAQRLVALLRPEADCRSHLLGQRRWTRNTAPVSRDDGSLAFRRQKSVRG